MPRNLLEERAIAAISRLESCEICPRHCRVNRLEDEKGFCRGERYARIYSYAPHFGEEPPLVGTHGSGTIFFSGCNLTCVFCQNYEISQLDQGMKVRPRRPGHGDDKPSRLGMSQHKLRFAYPLRASDPGGPGDSQGDGPDSSPCLQQRWIRLCGDTAGFWTASSTTTCRT
jgi:hypothetical protein